MKKKKDDGLRAVICLAVATLAVGGASIAISKMDNGGNEDRKAGVVLDITGANEKIKEAVLQEDGTYTVVIAEQGYIDEIVLEATYSADGQKLLSYDIISHKETEGYGSKADENDYKDKLAGARLPITTSGLDISGILGLEQETEPETAELKDGTYTEKTEAGENGDYNYVTLTVEDSKVTEVVWDEITNGASKAELSANGQYVMVEGNPTWKEQSEALGAYVVSNQTTEGIMNENGRTDVVSGVSISVNGFVELTNRAMAQAAGKDAAVPVADAVTVDVISGATFTSRAVIRAIDEGFVYLRDFVLNK